MANGNGNKITLAAVVLAVALAFGGFTVWKVYIRDPECYASKVEFREFKAEVKDDLKQINRKLDTLIWRSKDAPDRP